MRWVHRRTEVLDKLYAHSTARLPPPVPHAPAPPGPRCAPARPLPQFWPLVAHKVVGCLLIMVVFTASVLLFKGAYTQAALMLISLPVFLLRFDT